MPALISASVNGSTAVEFSGQTTKSGCGAPPGGDVGGQLRSVASTWLWVTWR